MSRIEVDLSGNQTTITVEHWPNESVPYQISTSVPDADISALPDSLRKAIGRRKQRGGAMKGRVLYAEQLGLAGRRIVVGALILHVDARRQPEILNLGVADFKDGQDRKQVIATMLACVTAIALECNCRSVTWLAHSDSAAAAAAAFGYRRLPRGGNAPRGVIRLSRQIQN